MTIVFLSPRFYPDIGGVEKHAFEVAKILVKKNDVIVITEGKKDKRENLKGIKIIRLSFGKKDWFRKFIIWGKLLKYRKIIEKADIVHCHDVFFWYIPLRIIFPRKKVFTTFHGYETVFPPKTKAIFMRKLSEKLSNGNIAVGDYIRKWYGTKSNWVIYGGSDKQNLKKTKRKTEGKINILFIGRIEKDTGVETYSKTLKLLGNLDRKAASSASVRQNASSASVRQNASSAYNFEACGDGSLRSSLEKYGKVHGFVKDLNKYVANADIIFASSYLSIILGLSLKKPVFSVFENPLKENYLKLAPFSKWIYTAKSPKVLVKKIKTVMRNKKLREKNINLAYNWSNEQTWDKITDIYLKLWRVK